MKTFSSLRVLKHFVCSVGFSTVVGVVFSSAFAADLVEVYNQALTSDPTFKVARATWMAKRENTPIARAALLPQLSATAGVNRVHTQLMGSKAEAVENDASADFYSTTKSYGLSLTQPIFNFSNWAALRSANATVKQAEADFSSAAQELMFRVSSAYFAVLNAQDVLRYTREQKKAVAEQLRQQMQRFKVGLIAITDVNDAQATYDTVVAQEVKAQNDLQNQQEKLQEITGIRYDELTPLKEAPPLVRPDPEDMELWVKKAEQQNYSLLSARYAATSARENISVKFGGHVPTLNVTGAYNYSRDNNLGGSETSGGQKAANAGLSLNVPLFSGGSVSANTEQTRQLYQQAVAAQEKAYRTVMSETRQAYLGVMSGISKLQADKQEVQSKNSRLESTVNSYDAGMRTMFEVLQAQTDLYNSEKNYAADQYAYISSTLSLKLKAGILSVADLEIVNRWLGTQPPIKNHAVAFAHKAKAKKKEKSSSKSGRSDKNVAQGKGKSKSKGTIEATKIRDQERQSARVQQQNQNTNDDADKLATRIEEEAAAAAPIQTDKNKKLEQRVSHPQTPREQPLSDNDDVKPVKQRRVYENDSTISGVAT
jgi:outer membrane protein